MQLAPGSLSRLHCSDAVNEAGNRHQFGIVPIWVGSIKRLDYYRARYYDSANGRFISEDPLGFGGEDGNLSRYVRNNPTNLIDFTGEEPTDPLNRLDQAVAGFGNAVTFGGTNYIREKLYGETATQNHQGGFYQGGEVAGGVTSFALGYGAEANLVKLAPGLVKGVRGYDALGTAIGGINGIKNIATGCGDWTDWLSLAPALGGASYWKQFKFPQGISFNADIPNHLKNVVDVVSKKNKGVVGGHNLDAFNQAVRNHGIDIVNTRISSIKGLQDHRYRLPELNKQRNPTGNFREPVKFPKTVYDPRILPDSLIVDLGQKASAKGLRTLAPGKDQFTEIAGGMKFRVYVDPGTMNIRNFHPEL